MLNINYISGNTHKKKLFIKNHTKGGLQSLRDSSEEKRGRNTTKRIAPVRWIISDEIQPGFIRDANRKPENQSFALGQG